VVVEAVAAVAVAIVRVQVFAALFAAGAVVVVIFEERATAG
jgi:hypothetical protein